MIDIGAINTTIKLNAGNAVKTLNTMAKRINDISAAIEKANKSAKNITININNVDKRVQNVNKSVNTTNKNVNNVTNSFARANIQATNAANSANKIATNTFKANTAAQALLRTVRSLAGGYLALQAAKQAVTSSDVITSAENKFGAMGFDSTQSNDIMDKIYNASQNARTGYSAMLSNVGKAFTLAPDAFQGNIDNAIKFQETMAKTYALGGASAQEQSTSMYQMIQALGSGILQGDELRSVREGAPLAYQAIEQFAQGIYGANENLKELASEGKITSDIVVAAITGTTEVVDAKFAETKMTFAQFWTMFKNSTTQAFKPFLQAMNDVLNHPAVQKLGNLVLGMIQSIADSLTWLLNSVVKPVLDWVNQNWEIVEAVIIAGIAVWIGYLGFLTAKILITFATWVAGAIMANLATFGIILTIFAVVAAIVYFANTSATAIDFVLNALTFLALGIVVIGIITGSTALIIVGIIIILAALFLAFAGEIIGGAYGIANVFLAVCKNIGIFFSNLWYGATSSFWNFIGDVLSGISDLEPAFNAIAKLFGIDGVTLSGLTNSAYSNANAASSNVKSYNDIGDAWSTAYAKGYDVGTGIQDKVGNFASGIQDKITGLGTFNGESAISDALGGIEDNTGKTAANTASLADEDLKYLRQLAEQEWKKEYTTREVTVNLGGVSNTVNEKSDLDGIVTYLSDALKQDLEMSALGVHA